MNGVRNFQFWLLSLLLCTTSCLASLGGELAVFNTPEFTPDVTHRQNVCDRYAEYRSKKSDLRSGLQGMQLNVVVGNYVGSYFSYDPETGINSDYPGIMAVIMDELGNRAGFTWRESFGLYDDPGENKTWTELLFWSMETYDVSMDWWTQTMERMNGGTAFLKEWLDSSIILVTNKEQELAQKEINPWNWTKPFDGGVWLMTLFTVLASGVVYQILEWYADEREDRTGWEWWLENFYMSALNFTQAYEYEPKTLASRIFGLSVAMWGLLMTATYTANLASLLIDTKSPTPGPATMDQVAFYGYSVCVWEGTYMDTFIKEEYPDVNRVPKANLLELYNGLKAGDCDYILTSVASWNRLKGIKEYNGDCDMYRVAEDRKVKLLGAGFATKADSGELCTGFIRDVLNVHMHDLIDEGFLEEVWDFEYKNSHDQDCSTHMDEVPEAGSRRRNLLQHLSNPSQSRILRRGGGGGATAGAVANGGEGGDGEGEGQMTPDQMIGTFVFHWGLMALSLVVAFVNGWYKNYKRSKKGEPCIQANTSPTKRMDESVMSRDSTTARGSIDVNTAKMFMANTNITQASENSTNRMETQLLLKRLETMQRNEHEFRQAMLAEQQLLRKQNQDLQSQMELLVMYFSMHSSGQQQPNAKPFNPPEALAAMTEKTRRSPLQDVLLGVRATPEHRLAHAQDADTESTSGHETLDYNA